jgi:hypothetical protein
MWSVLGAYKICCVTQTSIPSMPITTPHTSYKSYGQANELARLRDQLDGQRDEKGGGGTCAKAHRGAVH